MRNCFMSTIVATFQLKHRNRFSLRCSKCGIPFLNLHNCMRHCKICTNFNLFNKSILKTHEKLVRRTASFSHFLCNALKIRNQKHLSSRRLSVPMFIGTSCRFGNLDIKYVKWQRILQLLFLKNIFNILVVDG